MEKRVWLLMAAVAIVAAGSAEARERRVGTSYSQGTSQQAAPSKAPAGQARSAPAGQTWVDLRDPNSRAQAQQPAPPQYQPQYQPQPQYRAPPPPAPTPGDAVNMLVRGLMR